MAGRPQMSALTTTPIHKNLPSVYLAWTNLVDRRGEALDNPNIPDPPEVDEVQC